MQTKRPLATLVIWVALITTSAIASAAAPSDEPAVQPATNVSDASETAPLPESESVSVISPISPNEPDSLPGNTSASPADLWERIRNGFAMPSLDSEEVRNNEDFYVSQPVHVKRIVERGRRYLFHIVEEVERRGMPAEIALLPFIESAFNPRAYSNRHASGLWQLIPSTARTYGLKQNWWYDGRRDIIAATGAALDYLQNLYRIFGDWELVLASYNWGANAVGRSVIKNRNNGLPADFRHIALPPETQNYVPKLIAIRNIISNPAIFGIELESIPNQPYFEGVETTRPIDVKLAAKLANISLDEFEALNPAYNRPVININGSRTLLFPADKVEIFEENLRNHDKSLVSWQVYKVKNGETFKAIAERHGITERRLKAVNGVGRKDTLVPRQTLLVPSIGSANGADIANRSPKSSSSVVRE